MRLDPRLLANASVNTRSGLFRLKALFSEQRARQSREPRSRRDWEEMAIEWHAMANLAAGVKRESSHIDVALTSGAQAQIRQTHGAPPRAR
jgi:hypothetical protein